MIADGVLTGSEDASRMKESAPILSAIDRSQRAFQDWQTTCDYIDRRYSLRGRGYSAWASMGISLEDSELDMFWATWEVMKPAVYARPPVPAVSARFKDNDRFLNITAQMLQRSAQAAFDFTGMHEVMKNVRDDLLFTNRGVMWITYDNKDGEKKVCIEHVDRTDFVHEDVRYWYELGWVAKRSWLSKEQFLDRFDKIDERDLESLESNCITLEGAYGNKAEGPTQTPRYGVWEVWDKAKGKVYWVIDGYDHYLDIDEAPVKHEDFFPCPMPAYGTLRRRSLIPVPDWERVAIHFQQIDDLTRRLYELLLDARLRGIIAGGGDVADVVGRMFDEQSARTLYEVPIEISSQTGFNMQNVVQWLPLDTLVVAIQGLIEARSVIIDTVYELIGISDIMRGATDAQETLGAQQLKSQYGSIRVKEKIDALTRCAADAVKIVVEILAEKFTGEELMAMAQMKLPTRSDVRKEIAGIEKAAKEELNFIAKKAVEEAQAAQAQGQEVDPAQVEQMLQQAQQESLQKFDQLRMDAEQAIPIEEVMEMLRADKRRDFAFDVESDSTILTDEVAEKASRLELFQTFMGAVNETMVLLQAGPEGAELAGAFIDDVVGPFRPSGKVAEAIEGFVKAGPQIAERMSAKNGESEEMAAATKMLGEAEMAKAQAQTMKVEADAMAKQAENERKMQELQLKAQGDAAKFQNEQQKLMVAASQAEMKNAELMAKIDNIEADTVKKLTEAGLLVEDFNMRQFESLSDMQFRAQDQAVSDEQRMIDNDRAERGESRADNAEERAFRGEDRADRQQQFAKGSPN